MTDHRPSTSKLAFLSFSSLAWHYNTVSADPRIRAAYSVAKLGSDSQHLGVLDDLSFLYAACFFFFLISQRLSAQCCLRRLVASSCSDRGTEQHHCVNLGTVTETKDVRASEAVQRHSCKSCPSFQDAKNAPTRAERRVSRTNYATARTTPVLLGSPALGDRGAAALQVSG